MAEDTKVSGFGAPSGVSQSFGIFFSSRTVRMLKKRTPWTLWCLAKVNNRMHGHGVFTWADGRMYVWWLRNRSNVSFGPAGTTAQRISHIISYHYDTYTIIIDLRITLCYLSPRCHIYKNKLKDRITPHVTNFFRLI